MKVIELFAGIGSQTKALQRIGLEHEVVCVVEWDKYAYLSYKAIHGEVPNLGDITKVESLPTCDFLTYSFPCQDISVAGNQAGLSRGSGTRSGLLWEVERLLMDYAERDELPTYLLLENVKNLVGKKHKADFDEWLQVLDRMGYNTYWKVLNAKNYGIPQNRERVFALSILKEKDVWINFTWPEPFDNGLRLKDFLEKEVDEKFYISDEKCSKLLAQLKTDTVRIDSSMIGYEGKPREYVEIMPSITAREYKEPRQVVVPSVVEGIDFTTNNPQIRDVANCISARTDRGISNRKQEGTGVLVKEATKQGYSIAYEGDSINLEQPNSKTRRGRVGVGVAQTLTTSPQQAVIEPNELNMLGMIDMKGNEQVRRVYGTEGISPTLNTMQGGHREPKVLTEYRIRKLTPKECWRLMGFDDEDFEKAAKVNSNSQLYKQAGNSIVVDVLACLFTVVFEQELLIQQYPLLA